MVDFEFVIDDSTTYYQLSDFKSPKAKLLFQSYRQLEKDYLQQEDKLNGLRHNMQAPINKEKKNLLPQSLIWKKEFCK